MITVLPTLVLKEGVPEGEGVGEGVAVSVGAALAETREEGVAAAVAVTRRVSGGVAVGEGGTREGAGDTVGRPLREDPPLPLAALVVLPSGLEEAVHLLEGVEVSLGVPLEVGCAAPVVDGVGTVLLVGCNTV